MQLIEGDENESGEGELLEIKPKVDAQSSSESVIVLDEDVAPSNSHFPSSSSHFPSSSSHFAPSSSHFASSSSHFAPSTSWMFDSQYRYTREGK